VWSVCRLPVVCDIRTSCSLNRWTDLDAFWQVHLCDPMTWCIRWGSLPHPEKGDLDVEPSAETCIGKLQPNCRFYDVTLGIQKRFSFFPNYFGLCCSYSTAYCADLRSPYCSLDARFIDRRFMPTLLYSGVRPI